VDVPEAIGRFGLGVDGEVDVPAGVWEIGLG
jgi:hypothetical protein